jgi:hypothetical protein
VLIGIVASVITDKDALVTISFVRVFLRIFSSGGPLPRIPKIPKKWFMSINNSFSYSLWTEWIAA